MNFRCDLEFLTLMRSSIRSFDICFLETNLFLISDQQFQHNITVVIPLLTKLIHSVVFLTLVQYHMRDAGCMFCLLVNYHGGSTKFLVNQLL